MRRAGEGEVGEAQLLDAAQPLERGVIDEADFAQTHRQGAVDGAANVNALVPLAHEAVIACVITARKTVSADTGRLSPS
jgi:hypothetical protein